LFNDLRVHHIESQLNAMTERIDSAHTPQAGTEVPAIQFYGAASLFKNCS